jgi:excisionase family DNA binding protein
MTLAEVGDELGCSPAQTYSLVRSGSLRAIKIGGRGQWRVSLEDLQAYIDQAYSDTRAFVQAHPFGTSKGDDDAEASKQIPSKTVHP